MFPNVYYFLFHIINIEEGNQMQQKQKQIENLASQYQKWYRLNRKARKENNFHGLFSKLFGIMFPEIVEDQLLISPEEMLDKFQLFFNTSVTYHESKKDELICQNPVVDYMLVLSGQFSYKKLGGKDYRWKQSQSIAFDYYLYTKSQRIELKAEEESIYLKSQRKLIDKFRNDIMRQDRDTKEIFLSNFLFCNLSPAYTVNNIKIIKVQQNHSVQFKAGMIYLLYNGLIKRKLKGNKCFDGTELTNGCILSWKMLAHLLEQRYRQQDEQYIAKTNSCLVAFQEQQMSRIIKLNTTIKTELLIRLKQINSQREFLFKRSDEIINSFNNKSTLEHEEIIINYPIQFNSRNIKSSTISRSFRRKQKFESQEDFGEFITFNRYDKMMESKEKVVIKKHAYFHLQSRNKDRPKPIHTVDYEKKLKHQNKMMKIQTGKIQKLTLKCTSSEFKTQNITEIKKKLLNVTHLFDEPLAELPTPELSRQTSVALQAKQNKRNTKASLLRPEDFLKNQYLQEYLQKQKTRYSLNHQQLAQTLKQKQNKQSKFQQINGPQRNKTMKGNFFMLTSLLKNDQKTC